MMNAQLHFPWLDEARPQSPREVVEMARLKRLLRRLPCLVETAITKARKARERGAARIRTDWLVAELSMFHGLEIGNENREALARLVHDAAPDLRPFIHLRKSRRADFLKRKEPRA